ncbi:MAG: hypothetical protein AAF734_10390 [Bacteroidota bacterium]
MKVHLDSKLATISINEEKKTAFLYWKPFKNTEEYKHVLEKGLEAIETYQIENWIPDISEAKIVSPEDRKWAEEVFIPEALRLGIKRIAFVLPAEDAFKKHYANKLRESVADKEVIFETFGSLRDAERWVTRQVFL